MTRPIFVLLFCAMGPDWNTYPPYVEPINVQDLGDTKWDRLELSRVYAYINDQIRISVFTKSPDSRQPPVPGRGQVLFDKSNPNGHVDYRVAIPISSISDVIFSAPQNWTQVWKTETMIERIKADYGQAHWRVSVEGGLLLLAGQNNK
jgi:hypothetical protein